MATDRKMWNWFWYKLEQVACRARAWGDELCGSKVTVTRHRSRSHQSIVMTTTSLQHLYRLNDEKNQSIATCQHNGVAPGDYWCYKPKQLTTQQVQRCTLHDSSTSAFCLRQCNREWMRFSASTSTVEEPVPADCFVTWFDSTSYDIVERIVDGGNFWGTSPPLRGNLNRQQMRPGLATQEDNLKAIQGSTGLVDSHHVDRNCKIDVTNQLRNTASQHRMEIELKNVLCH